MTRQCLIAVQGPLQFVSGYHALEWYGSVKHTATDADPVLLLYDFHTTEEQEKCLYDAVMQISGIRKWERIVFIGGHEMARIMRQPYGKSIVGLQNRIGNYKFDEVYLARNYLGHGSSLILNAYPKAVHIMYGDGFGVIDEAKDYFRNSADTYLTLANLPGKIKSFAREFLYGKVPAPPKFDAAVMALPVDRSGTCLNEIPLFVPPRSMIVDTVSKCSKLLPELSNYCNALLNDVKGDCYLFLSSIFTECGYASQEKEAALYEEIIRATAPKGAMILIKSHPRNFSQVNKILVSLISTDYKVKVITDSRYRSTPVEFWVPLIERCHIITMASCTSVLSLKYIYNKDVIYGMNEKLVRKYILRQFQEAVIKGDFFWRLITDRLKDWDGQSVLWRQP